MGVANESAFRGAQFIQIDLANLRAAEERGQETDTLVCGGRTFPHEFPFDDQICVGVWQEGKRSAIHFA